MASYAHHNEMLSSITGSEYCDQLQQIRESKEGHSYVTITSGMKKIPLPKYVEVNLINVWTMTAEKC